MNKQFRLVAEKRCLKVQSDRLVADPARFESMPNQPANLETVEGDYKAVSARACHLNRVQEQLGRLDYLYSPAPVPSVTGAA